MYKKEFIEQIIKLRKNNKTIQEIALITKKTESSLRVWFSKNKIYKADNKILLIDKLTSEELAYIAGIIDGEGSIIISKQSPNLKKREINYRYQLFVKVTNTDKRLIQFLSEKTLQPFFKDKNRIEDRPNSRQTYSIHWPVNITIHLLEKIYPYLVIKKEQVDLAIKFKNTFEKEGHEPASLNIIQEREQMYLEMKALHKREF